MDPTHVKKLWRVAVDMQERLTLKDQIGSCLTLPTPEWQRCQERLARMAQLREQDWQASLRLLEPDTDRQLGGLIAQLESLAARLAKICSPRPITTPADILRDLVALDEEFESLHIDFKEHTLSVTTEAIELADEYLGSFVIELKWSTFDCPGLPYRIHSLESPDADVPHPHVRDEILCEGDATEPIAKALEQGRIYDFFVVVRQVLRNYNPHSAFEGFTDSQAIPCIDCGYRAGENERIWCRGCDNDVCDECSRLCESCSQSRCHGCVETCNGCDDYTCAACQKKCSSCDEIFCKGCLTDGECKNCREEEVFETAGADTPATGAEPPLLAVCVGEAALSA
ncbi:MAG: hypothetical protein WD851_12245 [Pirellulales bacterium]